MMDNSFPTPDRIVVDTDEVMHLELSFNWGVKGWGFGQMYLYKDEDNSIHLDDEFMGREVCRAILHRMIDVVVDSAILDSDVTTAKMRLRKDLYGRVEDGVENV